MDHSTNELRSPTTSETALRFHTINQAPLQASSPKLAVPLKASGRRQVSAPRKVVLLPRNDL